jgi:hypothetical protein
MLALCTALLGAAMPFFDETPVSGLGIGILAVCAMIGLRTGRLLWLFWKLLLVFAQEAQDGRRTVPGEEWNRPDIGDNDYAVPVRSPHNRDVS